MILPRWRVAAILFSALFLFACVEDKDYGDQANSLRPNENQNATVNVNSNANLAEDNALKLSEYVNIPYETEQDTVWREDELDKAKGGGKKLTAVFRFSEEDSKRIREDLAAKRPPFEAKVDAESWFPAELIAKSATTGDDTLKGKGYSAESLVKPPYKSGTLVHIEDTDYFVLTLLTR
jgi:hypothetical protein